MHAADRGAGGMLSTFVSSHIDFSSQNPCISGTGPRMEKQVVSGPPIVAAIQQVTPTHQCKEG
jgi:hypothetical protein